MASGDFDLVLMRKDPPVDQRYLHALWMLDHCDAPVINEPEGLRSASEKLFALQFPDWIPPTIVTSRREELDSFCREQGGRIVLKPIDGFAGRGVYAWSLKEANRGVIWEEMTERGTRPVLAQRFLPEVKRGDKRILVWNGRALGAVNREAKSGEVRSNLAAGGTAVKSSITAREHEMVEALAPYLIDHGLYFVGLDVIGGYLTEVNVTSPTCLVELESFTGIRHSEQMVRDWDEVLG
jgi:glutathione synthase